MRTLSPAFSWGLATKVSTIPIVHLAEATDPDACTRAPHTSTARSYLVLGTPQDRVAFTTAIRAFALAGRWGDRLTIVGYGPHRRRMEKWTQALRIEGIVSFVDSDDPGAISVVRHDVAILISHRHDQLVMLLHALLNGLRILAIDENAAAAHLLRDGQLGMLFPARDVPALCRSILAVAEPDPAVVRRRLAPYLVSQASSEPAIRINA